MDLFKRTIPLVYTLLVILVFYNEIRTSRGQTNKRVIIGNGTSECTQDGGGGPLIPPPMRVSAFASRGSALAVVFYGNHTWTFSWSSPNRFPILVPGLDETPQRLDLSNIKSRLISHSAPAIDSKDDHDPREPQVVALLGESSDYDIPIGPLTEPFQATLGLNIIGWLLDTHNRSGRVVFEFYQNDTAPQELKTFLIRNQVNDSVLNITEKDSNPLVTGISLRSRRNGTSSDKLIIERGGSSERDRRIRIVSDLNQPIERSLDTSGAASFQPGRRHRLHALMVFNVAETDDGWPRDWMLTNDQLRRRESGQAGSRNEEDNDWFLLSLERYDDGPLTAAEVDSFSLIRLYHLHMDGSTRNYHLSAASFPDRVWDAGILHGCPPALCWDASTQGGIVSRRDDGSVEIYFFKGRYQFRTSPRSANNPLDGLDLPRVAGEHRLEDGGTLFYGTLHLLESPNSTSSIDILLTSQFHNLSVVGLSGSTAVLAPALSYNLTFLVNGIDELLQEATIQSGWYNRATDELWLFDDWRTFYCKPSYSNATMMALFGCQGPRVRRPPGWTRRIDTVLSYTGWNVSIFLSGNFWWPVPHQTTDYTRPVSLSLVYDMGPDKGTGSSVPLYRSSHLACNYSAKYPTINSVQVWERMLADHRPIESPNFFQFPVPVLNVSTADNDGDSVGTVVTGFLVLAVVFVGLALLTLQFRGPTRDSSSDTTLSGRQTTSATTLLSLPSRAGTTVGTAATRTVTTSTSTQY